VNGITPTPIPYTPYTLPPLLASPSLQVPKTESEIEIYNAGKEARGKFEEWKKVNGWTGYQEEEGLFVPGVSDNKRAIASDDWGFSGSSKEGNEEREENAGASRNTSMRKSVPAILKPGYEPHRLEGYAEEEEGVSER